MTLAESVAACHAKGLGTSDMLDCLDASNACGDRLPTATAGASGVVFGCSSVPSTKKAAALLAEAQARSAPSGPPWLLIGGGVAVVGLVIYLATR